jgi:hypothetical protein
VVGAAFCERIHFEARPFSIFQGLGAVVGRK